MIGLHAVGQASNGSFGFAEESFRGDSTLVFIFVGHSNLGSSVAEDCAGTDGFTVLHPRLWNFNIEDRFNSGPHHTWIPAKAPVHVRNANLPVCFGPSIPFVKGIQKYLPPAYGLGILQNAEGNAELRAHYLQGVTSKYGTSLRSQLMEAIRELKGEVLWGGLVVMLGICERKKETAAKTFAADMVEFTSLVREATGRIDLPLIMSQYEKGASDDFAIDKHYGLEIARQIDSLPDLLENVVVIPTGWSIDRDKYMQDSHHYNCRGQHRWVQEAVRIIVDEGLIPFNTEKDTVSPSRITDLDVQEASCTSVKLAWTEPSGGEDVVGYRVYIPQTGDFYAQSPILSAEWAVPDSSYTGTVAAVDWAGNWSEPVHFSLIHPDECSPGSWRRVVVTPKRVDCNSTVSLPGWDLAQHWTSLSVHGALGSVENVEICDAISASDSGKLGMHCTGWLGEFDYRFCVAENDYIATVFTRNDGLSAGRGEFSIQGLGVDTSETEILVPKEGRAGGLDSSVLHILADSLLTLRFRSKGEGLPYVSGIVIDEHPGFRFTGTMADTGFVGDTLTIRWNANRTTVWDANLYVSPNLGVEWYTINGEETIGRMESAWGEYEWRIPDSLGNENLEGAMLSFMLRNYDETVSEVLIDRIHIGGKSVASRPYPDAALSVRKGFDPQERVRLYDLRGRYLSPAAIERGHKSDGVYLRKDTRKGMNVKVFVNLRTSNDNTVGK